MKLDEFRVEFIEEIRRDAVINQKSSDVEFLNRSVSVLTEIGELLDPQLYYFGKQGPGNRSIQFDAYGFDEADKSLSLVINDFKDQDEPENLNNNRIDQLYSKMIAFLELSIGPRLGDYCDTSEESYKIGREIKRRFFSDTIQANIDDSIEKIKLFILTNSKLSNAVKKIDKPSFNGRKVELSIWTIERFYDIFISNSEREAITINTTDYGLKGIPCIKADISGTNDYEAYLAIVPGLFLAKVYYDHGSKLLEGNVRAFLSTKGNVNKGIKRTILSEPTKFFTYNNGIATTAESISVYSENDHLYISSFKDLQIINGGQTTASLTTAMFKEKNDLKDVFVQMKLTVIKNEDYSEMVQFISRYANSQNKVTNADLFSNHGFHVLFERLSKENPAPPAKGNLHSTFWYYERSRGKYQQEQFKIILKSEKNAFERKYPKNQVIKKEELAKYINSVSMKPHIVSRGNMKSMDHFANEIDKLYRTNKESINKVYYQRAIAAAIIFKEVDSMVYKAPWYQVNGNKSNVVTYSIAKLMQSIDESYMIDFQRIWDKQTMYPSLRREFEKLTLITNSYISNSGGQIVNEYCKKEETWINFKKVSYTVSDEFSKDLIFKADYEAKTASAKKEVKLENQVKDEIYVVNKGGKYWQSVSEKAKIYMDFREKELIELASRIDSPRGKIPTSKQAKEILKIEEKLKNDGII